MPWTAKQNRLWRAAEHNPEIAREHGLSHKQAKKMAHEGVIPAKPMNPVMHTHHPWENEVKRSARSEDAKARSLELRALKNPAAAKGNDYDHERPDEHGGERGRHLGNKETGKVASGVFHANRSSHHVMFGPGEGRGSGFQKGGGREHPSGGLSYLRGGSMAPLHAGGENFGAREGHDGTEQDPPDGSWEHEGREFGTENLKQNLGSKRKEGYGEPQGGTTGLPGFQKGGARDDLKDETRGTLAFPPSEYSGGRKVPQETKERIAKALLRARR